MCVFRKGINLPAFSYSFSLSRNVALQPFSSPLLSYFFGAFFTSACNMNFRRNYISVINRNIYVRNVHKQIKSINFARFIANSESNNFDRFGIKSKRNLQTKVTNTSGGDRIYFTKSHEYIKKVEGKKNEWLLGVTDYAIKQLGEIVYIENPEKEKYVKKGDVLLVIESVKAVGEVYAPFNIVVLDINNKLLDETLLLNEHSKGDGWLVKVKLMKNENEEEIINEIEGNEENKKLNFLMNEDEYVLFCTKEENKH